MRLFFFLVLVLQAGLGHATQWKSNAQIDHIVAASGLLATFVCYDLQDDSMTVCNGSRAERRYIPASTFKVLNSLIGLSTKAVASVDEVLPYGGGPARVKAWEKDMSLREAIVVSNVPVYQELARRIGLSRMREGVNRAEYGNQDIGTVVDTFWLRGPLRISAVEQARFLARLAKLELPFPKQAQEAVKEILVAERGPEGVLYAKTGWAVEPEQIGWWVGFVERQGRTYTFALNLDMLSADAAPKRQELGRACLGALGLL